MALALWLALQSSPSSLQSVQDWLAIVLSGAAVIGVLYGGARTIVRLNGLGGRVRKVETRTEELSANHHTIERELFLLRERSGYTAEKMGALESQQRTLDQNFQKLATDLTETIVESSRAHVTALHQLGLEFAAFKATLDAERRIRRTQHPDDL